MLDHILDSEFLDNKLAVKCIVPSNASTNFT